MARYFINEEKYKEMSMFKVNPGDLIVSCSGVTLGRIAEIPKNALPGIINQALLKITLDPHKVNNEYFKTLFRSPLIQKKIFRVSRGSGIPNFPSMSEIKSLEFPTPPIELQNRFAFIVEKFQKTSIKRENLDQQTDILCDSLMHRAFRGDLKC